MDQSSCLCIDLGSSYTKVGVRKERDARTELVYDPHSDSEWNFCFPSTVARIERGGSAHWLCGDDALAQKPGDNVEIHRDWKAHFFGPKKSLYAKSEEAAGRFFAGLKDKLHSLGYKKLMARCATRICIPKLDESDERGRCLIEIAQAIGFTPVAARPYVYEPAANAFGVLTRGRNYTWKPKPWQPWHPSYTQIFEPTPRGLFAQLRSAARGNRAFSYTVLIIDIGSFTTDVGAIIFQMSRGDIDEFDRPTIHQWSKPLGIRDLDEKVLANLPATFRKAIESRPVVDWERYKQRLYAGNAIRVRSPSGESLEIGGPTNQRAVSSAINELAQRIGKLASDFCVEKRVTAQEAILTGGGAAIAPLRRQVLGELGNCIRGVTDLLDPNEPLHVLREKRTPRGWEFDQKEIDTRIRESHDLLRGGSAIGGCSVVIDHPQSR